MYLRMIRLQPACLFYQKICQSCKRWKFGIEQQKSENLTPSMRKLEAATSENSGSSSKKWKLGIEHEKTSNQQEVKTWEQHENKLLHHFRPFISTLQRVGFHKSFVIPLILRSLPVVNIRYYIPNADFNCISHDYIISIVIVIVIVYLSSF